MYSATPGRGFRGDSTDDDTVSGERPHAAASCSAAAFARTAHFACNL